MKKNTIKVIAYLFIILLVLGSCIRVYAVTEEELKNKQNEIEQQIVDAHTEIAGIKENMTLSLEQINKLNVQIKEAEEELSETNQKLDGLNEELEEKREELEIAQKNYDERKKLVDKRLVAIYESSKTTYLDVLLGSKGLSDFFTKYYLLEELAEYDNKLLQSLENYEDAVEIKNNLVKNKRDEVQGTKDMIESKTGAMEVLIEDKNNLVSSLSQEEVKINEQLEQFEIDKKNIENQLAELARQKALRNSITPSQSRIHISVNSEKLKQILQQDFMDILVILESILLFR